KDAPLALDDLIARMHRRDPAARASLAVVAADVETFLTAGEMLSDDANPGGTVPAVTGDERRLIAVIAIEPAHGKLHVDEAGPEADDAPPPSSFLSIATIVEPFGGDVVVLPSGRTIVTLSSGSAGVDLASRAAKCALSIRERVRAARIALASGRGDPL